jgi:hypothetical protein
VKPGENGTPANPNTERVESGESKSIQVQPLRGCVSHVFLFPQVAPAAIHIQSFQDFVLSKRTKIKEYRQTLIFEAVTGKICVH